MRLLSAVVLEYKSSVAEQLNNSLKYILSLEFTRLFPLANQNAKQRKISF